MPKSKVKDKRITARLTEAEKKMIETAANMVDEYPSEFARVAALDRAGDVLALEPSSVPQQASPRPWEVSGVDHGHPLADRFVDTR